MPITPTAPAPAAPAAEAPPLAPDSPRAADMRTGRAVDQIIRLLGATAAGAATGQAGLGLMRMMRPAPRRDANFRRRPVVPLPYAAKAANAAPEPSAAAQAIVHAVGLGREGAAPSSLRDHLNPADATSAAEMPWAWAAATPLALGAFQLGRKPVASAFNALTAQDRDADLVAAKKRYQRALEAVALRKAASAADPDATPTLDGLAEAYGARAGEKRAGFLTPAESLLGLLLGGTATAGAAFGYNDASESSSGKLLARAQKARQRKSMQGVYRPILVKPVPLQVGPAASRARLSDGAETALGVPFDAA